MKLSVTIKNGSLDITTGNIVNKYVSRLNKTLTNFNDDLTALTLHIKKHERHHFYSGVFTLRLPHDRLIANVGSHDLVVLLRDGFETLEREIKSYKGKHNRIIT